MKPKHEVGITLVALIITIILLLILAGIAISLTIGPNGILEKGQQAKEETKKAEIQEEIQLAITNIITENASKGKKVTTLEIKVGLETDNSIQGIVVNEDLTGSYEGYEYYIDENYNVHIGNVKETTNYIKLQEKKRVITVSVTEVKEGIQKIELINPKGESVVNKEYDGVITEATIEVKANLSGNYKSKLTTSNNTVEEKTITVDKMEISNLAQLTEFAEMIEEGITFEGDTVYIVDDIDLGGSSSNRNWNAIGNMTTNKYFAGILEGNNHKILNLYNTKTSEPRQGLFSYINGGTIQNLGIESGHIMCKFFSGGIVGRIDNGDIIRCYNKAKIECVDTEGTAGTMGLGGIVGMVYNTTIKECYNNGEITGTLDVAGGIVGSITFKTEVINCYNIGDVTTLKGYVGGIAGLMQKDDRVYN